jgi:hypothetical protein
VSLGEQNEQECRIQAAKKEVKATASGMALDSIR